MLIVNSSNAFSNISREAMIHIKIKCITCGRYVVNTYKEPAKVMISSQADQTLGNPKVMQSTEGTTQDHGNVRHGNDEAPRYNRHENTNMKKVAYAYDLTGGGKIAHLKHWSGLVLTYGPKVGSLPNAARSVLIVKPEHFGQAVFQNSGIKVTKTSKRHHQRWGHLTAVLTRPDFEIANYACARQLRQCAHCKRGVY